MFVGEEVDITGRPLAKETLAKPNANAIESIDIVILLIVFFIYLEGRIKVGLFIYVVIIA